MRLAATIRSIVHRFDSLREVMAKANSKESGDDLAGISARSAVERVAARAVLANVTLRFAKSFYAGESHASGRCRARSPA